MRSEGVVRKGEVERDEEEGETGRVNIALRGIAVSWRLLLELVSTV
jgi:hypothetical protein